MTDERERIALVPDRTQEDTLKPLRPSGGVRDTDVFDDVILREGRECKNQKNEEDRGAKRIYFKSRAS